jgi:peptide/nickel transport system ATP-binding protein
MSAEHFLEVEGVSRTFGQIGWRRKRAGVAAVSEVSMYVDVGESVGIVGESGSGKSTLANMVCGLLRPDSGSIRLDGKDVHAGRKVNRSIWRNVQLVFQDPYSSLNPAMTVGETLAEPMRLWHGTARNEALRQARDLLDRVGLDPDLASVSVTRLSGGQRQRVSIGRALAVQPRLMVFDESVSALDVSVQAQVLELLHNLRRDTGMAYVFISHDIGVIRLISDRVVVMKEGEIVEACAATDLSVGTVAHTYTKRLLAAVPRVSTLPGPRLVPEVAS